MKIYIAGKITGDPNYKEKFNAIEEYLKKQGHSVMNPAILPQGFEQGEYMQVCLNMLSVCEAIFLLPDWRDSKGAFIEFNVAKMRNMRIFEEII